VASPRLRRVRERHPEIEIVHRCFALAPVPEAIVWIFGSKERGKAEILEHWRRANELDDAKRFRPDLMAQRPFDYPYSLPGLLACKAAEFLGGQEAHWNLFDRIQTAHLVECRNIADEEVLRACAAEVGLDVTAWEEAFRSEAVYQAVQRDVERARALGVHAVPTIVVAGRFALSGARPEAQYEAWLARVARELALPWR